MRADRVREKHQLPLSIISHKDMLVVTPRRIVI